MDITTTQRKELIKTLAIESLPSEAQDEILTSLGEDIMKQVLLDIYDSVSEESQQKIKAALEGTISIDDLLAELEPQIENFEEILSKASLKSVADFKELFSADATEYADLDAEEARLLAEIEADDKAVE